MIERIKTPIFNKLTKNIDLLVLRQSIGDQVMVIVSNVANEGAPVRLKCVEVNSKNIEYTETFTLRGMLREYPYPTEVIEAVQSDLRKAGALDVRIRMIVMRIGSYSYYIGELLWLWPQEDEDGPSAVADIDNFSTESSCTGV